MDNWNSFCYILYFVTAAPIYFWLYIKDNQSRISRWKSLFLLIIPFFSFVPCFIRGYQVEIRVDNMILAGKIIDINNLRVTNVLIEGFPEYIPLDCLTNDLSMGDSFYRPRHAGGLYWLYKKDSTGKYREIMLYRTGELNACTWKWVNGR
jgi:hypothetical protein